MLELRELTVRRGPEPVVTRLNVAIRPGRIFWVTGPNGSGKSSLLRVLALLDPPVAGRVRYAGPGGDPVLYFHSEMTLPPSSTVGAWDRLADRLLGPGEPPSPAGLRPPVGPGRKVGRLSTGERKRLLLDVVMRRRGALLLDEPYEHLSPDGKAALTAALLERVAESVVVVATNQTPEGVALDLGVRLEAGVATALEASAPDPVGGDA